MVIERGNNSIKRSEMLDQLKSRLFKKEPKDGPKVAVISRNRSKDKAASNVTFKQPVPRSYPNDTNIIQPIANERLDYFLETPRFDDQRNKPIAEQPIQSQLTVTSLKELLKPTHDIDDLSLSISNEAIATVSDPKNPQLAPTRDELSQTKEELQACKREIEAIRSQNRQLENTLMQIGERLSQEMKEKCDLVTIDNEGSETAEPRG